jgi:hypothetical protein
MLPPSLWVAALSVPRSTNCQPLPPRGDGFRESLSVEKATLFAHLRLRPDIVGQEKHLYEAGADNVSYLAVELFQHSELFGLKRMHSIPGQSYFPSEAIFDEDAIEDRASLSLISIDCKAAYNTID